MNHSESIKAIAPAIVIAWENIGAATKDASNPYFKSKFATLGEVMSVVKGPLLDQGIAVLQPVDGDHVETILLHTSGEWISGRMKLVCAKENDPQALGSAVSYAKRYLLQAMCFVPSEDDDGEGAMKRQQSQAPRQTQDPNDLLQDAANRSRSKEL